MERTSNRNLWIGLGIVALLLLVALPAWGGGMMIGRGVVGPFGVHPFVAGGTPFVAAWGVSLLIRVALWAGIIYLAVHLFRRSRFAARDHYDEPATYPELSSEEILRRRYAAGEITREQYDEMLRVLHPTVS
jgi:putative membrane protein